MAGKRENPSDPLLPTVNEPGTFAWCEEVVECMNAAWTAREHGEQGFLAAVRAALTHRIWETLSPPPPQEPYTSLTNLIRRTAPDGQAEAMQLVVKFSGLGETPGETVATPWAMAAGATRQPGASAPWTELVPDSTEDPEVALGRKLLEEFEAQMAEQRANGLPAGMPPRYQETDGQGGAAGAAGTARVTPAQRKREKLAAAHPDLLDAVQAGEMTLKQAYVEAGIEKPPQTLDRLQKLWRNASEEERERFGAWVQEQLQKVRKAEYEAEVYGES